MILILMTLILMSGNPPMTINFGEENDNTSWYVVNDGVMGGLSAGQVAYTDSSALWAGRISLDNNGGFSALRSDFGDYDLSKYTEAVIRFRSEGQILSFGLYPHQRFYMPYYKVDLGDTDGQWEELTISLSDFHKYILGRKYEKTLSKEPISRHHQTWLHQWRKEGRPFYLRDRLYRVSIDALSFCHVQSTSTDEHPVFYGFWLPWPNTTSRSRRPHIHRRFSVRLCQVPTFSHLASTEL